MRKPTDFPAPDLDELVFLCLERMETDPDALAALCRDHPGSAELLTERIDNLRANGLLELRDRAQSPPERLGEFRLIRELGAGGMGVVYLAEQTSLGREVAVKLARSAELLFPEARGRFRREAEAVARLAHPNIAAVHTVGEEGGLPYFAMEYVAGLSLADVIDAWRGRDPTTLTGADLRDLLDGCTEGDGDSELGDVRIFSGSWVEAVMLIVRQVAEALEHAHRRGVVHRDVKPSNIMLDRAGRVLLLDFGLAMTHGTSRLTRTGALLGSLPYLGPEATKDDGQGPDEKATGAAADVYALGVTLYELLTLELPFRGERANELIQSIAEGNARPVRRGNPRVSADLETVVATAMAPELDRRYPSADALARDLSNVLESRPIDARRAGHWVRLSRWRRRRPGWAAAASLGFILVVVSPTVIAIQTHQANKRIAESHRKAKEALGLLTRVGEEVNLQVPAEQEAHRRRLMAGAIEFWRGFVAESDDDPVSRFELAQALERIGFIQERLGDYREAIASMNEATDRYTELWNDEGHVEARLMAAAAQRTAGYAHHMLGETAEGAAAMERGLALLVDFDVPRHRVGDRLIRMANLSGQLGELRAELGEYEAAYEHLDRAIQLYEEVRPLRPDDAMVNSAEARAYSVLGGAYVSNGRHAEARDMFEVGLELAFASLEQAPGDTNARLRVVTLFSNLGSTKTKLGDYDGAAADFEEAEWRGVELTEDHPGPPSIRRAQWMAHYGKGNLFARQARFAEAAAAFEDARGPARALVRAHGDLTTYGVDLGLTEARLGRALVGLERFEEAEQVLSSGCESIAAARAKSPAEHRGAWNEATFHLGTTRAKLGDASGAAEALMAVEETDDGELALTAARTLAELAAAVVYDPSADEAEAALRVAPWIANAKRLLSDATRIGLPEGAADEDDPVWQVLKQR